MVAAEGGGAIMTGSELTESDYRKLSVSWIPRELANAAGIIRVDSREGADLVGRNGNGDYAGLAFPYHWPGENQTREYRLRRDHPDLELQPDGSTKEKNKYLSPPGRASKLYFAPDATLGMLAGVNLPIVICEGEKKCLALSRLASYQSESPRFLPIGISGVWNWRGKRGRESGPDGNRVEIRGPIADLDRIAWKGRKVYILVDHETKPEIDREVNRARRELAKELEGRGATTFLPDPPCIESGEKTGIDDYLAHSEGVPENALSLIDTAPRFRSPTVAEILANCGLTALVEGCSPDNVTNVLRAFVENLDDAKPLVRESAVAEAIKYLRLIKVEGARKRVEAALREHVEIPAVLPATLQQSPEEMASLRETAWIQCKLLALKLNILEGVAEVMHQFRIVGEDRLVKLAYLILTSRLLERPANFFVKGPSAAGKSYSIETLLQLFPTSAYYALTAMSEHGLIYLTEPMAHRVLIIYEAAGLESDFQSYLIRSLLSEGRIKYQTNEKVDDKIQSRLIELEGPTGLITTTTAVSLHPENETRAMSISVNDSQEQTKAIMLAQAREQGAGPDIAQWVALQEWLSLSECAVTIPYATALAGLIPPVAVRLRRDFVTILNLIRSHAVLHQATRQRNPQDQIIATLDDYEAVRELVADLVATQADATVPETVRSTVMAVAELKGNTNATVSVSQLAKKLSLDKSSVSRRVKNALKLEYLKNLEDKRGKPYRLDVGDPLPEERTILPDRGTLEGCCSVAPQNQGISVTPLSQKSGSAALLPSTDAPEWLQALSRRLQDIKRKDEAAKEVVYV
jgi:hypothetical protein